ncbi:hypothetical protein BFL43_17230 [Williamsia sp. 1135]|nr:hypothetical protein BFL43_17230 [Williamsia sp. 1135]
MAEAALDGLIDGLTTENTASSEADTPSEEAATQRTEARAAALADDIARLRSQVEQFRGQA